MRKILWIIAIIGICVSCKKKHPGEYFNEALKLEQNGDYEAAIKLLDEAINIDPRCRPALLNRGVDKSILEDYSGAIKDYELLISVDKKNALALFNMGKNYGRLNDYKQGIILYNKTLNMTGCRPANEPFFELVDPANDWDRDSDYHVTRNEVLFERGIAYAETDQHKKAIVDMQYVVDNELGKESALVWIGESYLALKDTTMAVRNLEEATQLGMTDAKEILDQIRP